MRAALLLGMSGRRWVVASRVRRPFARTQYLVAVSCPPGSAEVLVPRNTSSIRARRSGPCFDGGWAGCLTFFVRDFGRPTTSIGFGLLSICAPSCRSSCSPACRRALAVLGSILLKGLDHPAAIQGSVSHGAGPWPPQRIPVSSIQSRATPRLASELEAERWFTWMRPDFRTTRRPAPTPSTAVSRGAASSRA